MTMYNIIFNPVAGKKRAFQNLEVVKRVMDEAQMEYKVYKSGGIHDAEYIARDLTQKGETKIIVLGGDGTLNEVLNGKRPVSIELALLMEAALGINADLLVKMQTEYNMQTARKSTTLMKKLNEIRKIAAVL